MSESTEVADKEKLARIEEMMHPGYWGTYDFRRAAILKVLGSTRTSWTKEPDEFTFGQ